MAARFDYHAINKDGATVSGSLDCNSSRSAIRQLQRQGLTPTDIQSQELNTGKSSKRPPKRPVILMVMHQLTTLLHAGVALDEALLFLSDSLENVFLKVELKELVTRLRRGMIFSEALNDSRIELPTYMYHLAEAGELTGNLAGALADGVKQMEYEHNVSKELRNALIYPSILVISGIGAVMLIFILVVPKFVNLLNKGNNDVPFLARAVLETGQFFNSHLLAISITLLILGLSFAYALKQPKLRQKLWDWMLQLPAIGPWLTESDIGRWANMLTTLLSSKIGLIRALEIAQQGIAGTRLRTNLSHVTKSVQSGIPLSAALQESQSITATGYGLVQVGERSGNLAEMLGSLAVLYTENGRERMKNFLTLLEPIAILLIGGVIGVIMTGIILAITSVNNISL